MTSFEYFAKNVMADVVKGNNMEVEHEETTAVHEMTTSDGIDNPDKDNEVDQVELEETSAVHEMKTSAGNDNPEHVDLLVVNDEDFKNIVKKEVGCPPSKANEPSKVRSDEESSIAKKFICSKCNSDFSTKPEFREHYKQVHLDEAAGAFNKGNDRKSVGNNGKRKRKYKQNDFFGTSSCMKGLPKTTRISFLNPSNSDPLEIKKEDIKAEKAKMSRKSYPNKNIFVKGITEKTDNTIPESKQIENISCNVCNKNFATKKGMHKHNREIHGIRLRNRKKKNSVGKVKTEKTDENVSESKQIDNNCCHVCNKNFKDKKKMNKHNRQSHGIRIRNPYKTKSINSDNNTQVQMIKEVSSKFKFGKGIKISCQPNPEANKTENKNIVEIKNVSIKKKNKLQVKCETCDQALPNKNELLKHKKDLHYMNCFKCSAKFEKESQLDEHMNKRHVVNCNKCEAIFDNKANYLIHKKEVHLYKCTHCGSCFDEKVKLDKHDIEYHNLKCRHCTNKFIDRDLLKAHIVKAHYHRCTECPSTFEEQSLLVKHEAKVHRSCEVCEDEFSWVEASHECYYTRNKLRPGF